MNRYRTFRELHAQARPLLIGNVWNVQSAKHFEKSGFQAIGTSSAAIAHSLGYEDGEQMPFGELLLIAERIARHVSIPLSVDIESGYGKHAAGTAGNIISLIQSGVAGVNIEDSFIENQERKLKDSLPFSQFLREVKEILAEQHLSVFLNVRCDAFLLNMPDALAIATERVHQYEQAGADGIFLPCITREDDIEKMVSATTLPLNVMCMPELPDFGTLEKLGVKRISMGNFLHDYTYAALKTITSAILSEQSFQSVFAA